MFPGENILTGGITNKLKSDGMSRMCLVDKKNVFQKVWLRSGMFYTTPNEKGMFKMKLSKGDSMSEPYIKNPSTLSLKLHLLRSGQCLYPKVEKRSSRELIHLRWTLFLPLGSLVCGSNNHNIALQIL